MRLCKLSPFVLLTILIFTGSLTAPGCATVAGSLPHVIAAVTDGIMVLDGIQTFVSAFFRVKPNPDLEKKVSDGMLRARASLNAALRLSQGAEKLDQAKVDEAFADFRIAYSDLLVLLGPLGVQQQGNALKATPGGMSVPAPLALSLRVAK